MIRHCRTCGRTYIKSRWCPNCYDDSGHLRVSRPDNTTADIWIGGVPHFVLRQYPDRAQVIRCDGVNIEPMRWVNLADALNS